MDEEPLAAVKGTAEEVSKWLDQLKGDVLFDTETRTMTVESSAA